MKMMKVPFKVDLKDKVCAITGAGGVICGEFASGVERFYRKEVAS